MVAPPVLELVTAELTVGVLPDKGADIYSFVDRASGIDVLFKTPWGRRDPATLPPAADSQADWMARYSGGWQQLLPNAGPARRQGGTELGFHGEASVVPWRLVTADHRSARLTVELLSVPLRIDRELRLDGPELFVRDVVCNLGPDPVPVCWVQHPAFGAPFLDGRCRIDSSARLFLSDAENPGTGVRPDTMSSWPRLPGVTGRDLTEVAGIGEARAVFGALTSFPTDAWFTVTSPTAGFGIRVEWDPAAFGHAWFWQECQATPGFPWFRRAYVVAVEPANVLPGLGLSGKLVRGDPPVLAGEAEWVSEVRMSRIELA